MSASHSFKMLNAALQPAFGTSVTLTKDTFSMFARARHTKDTSLIWGRSCLTAWQFDFGADPALLISAYNVDKDQQFDFAQLVFAHLNHLPFVVMTLPEGLQPAM
eukprot:1158592-Pelagomonas_calceolata.AAC.2